jgi:DNA-binding transcriptional regulator YiaG
MMHGVSRAGWAMAIRAGRLKRQLTQVELAALLGVSRHTVWSWEAGIRLPRMAARRALVEEGIERPPEAAA